MAFSCTTPFLIVDYIVQNNAKVRRCQWFLAEIFSKPGNEIVFPYAIQKRAL